MMNRLVEGLDSWGVVGVALLVSLSILGCGKESPASPAGGDAPTPVATTLTISETALSLSSVGATAQLTVAVLDQTGTAMSGTSVSWASSETDVAAVSTMGLVTAVATGTANITATLSSLQATAIVTVVIPGPVAYVLNRDGDDISVIDLATNSVIGPTIPVGDSPLGMAISPDGSRVYVAGGGAVWVIDTTTRAAVGPPIQMVAGPREVAITPDGTRAYVALTGPDEVAVIDLATNTVVATISVALKPIGVAITPNGAHAYIAGQGSVSVIEVATNTVIATIQKGAHGGFGWPVAAVTPDGTRVYWAGGVNNKSVGVIDVATNSLLAPVIPVGAYGSTGVAITPDGALVYVVIEVEDDGMPGNRGSVRVIDTATGMVIGEPILVGDSPLGIAITPDGERVYVTNRTDSSVSVIDVATNSVIGDPITVGPWPAAIVFVPEVP